MRSMHILVLLGLGLIGVRAGASQPAPNAATLAPVAVTGASNAAQINYSDLLAGVAAFKKYRHYAPNATLTFFLGPQSEIAAAPPITLDLQTDTNDFTVPVSADGKFDLPDAKTVAGGDGYLVANRADGKVGVVPTVRSGADTETAFRLGDLRLQCEVSWAIEKQHVPKAVRSFFFIGGRMCHSSKIAVNYFHASHKLSKAELSYQARQTTVPVAHDGVTFWPPLGDTSWPDDATVTLTFDSASLANTSP